MAPAPMVTAMSANLHSYTDEAFYRLATAVELEMREREKQAARRLMQANDLLPHEFALLRGLLAQ